MNPEKHQTAEQLPAEPLRAAAWLLAGIGIAAASIRLLRRKSRATRSLKPKNPPSQERSLTERLAQTGLEILPLLLPVLLEHRRERKPEVAAPSKPRTAYRIGAYAWPILLCLTLGASAGWLQHGAMTEWYPALLKPAATPPNLLFPIVWGILYVSMGIAAGRLITASKGPRREALTIWGIQLGVNFLWSILFFVCRSPLLGMIGIIVLDASVILCIDRSRHVRHDAAWLLLPYLLWILYATYLNGWILAANGPGI
ncbi:MAG: tryptophan-rich sensory protein [Bacteroides cellulosilyticus]|nr:tryptophan-rich sensory protein [Bacteroides cellulosilyticus]